MLTMVWNVTFRMDSKSPQKEITRYTRESAEHFAEGILEAGGVAIVVEDTEDIPEPISDDSSTPSSNNPRSLQWP